MDVPGTALRARKVSAPGVSFSDSKDTPPAGLKLMLLGIITTKLSVGVAKALVKSEAAGVGQMIAELKLRHPGPQRKKKGIVALLSQRYGRGLHRHSAGGHGGRAFDLRIGRQIETRRNAC